MPARNVHHDRVIRALVADGWEITNDPLVISLGNRVLFVDLGARRSALAAVKGGRKIAIEIQSFLSLSVVHDLHGAVGQYVIYRALLEKMAPGCLLYLALPSRVYDGFFSEPLGQFVVERLGLRLLIFDENREGIIQWIESSDTERS